MEQRYGRGVEVTNDGRAVPNGRPGHGLLGMRQRVDLYGGDLDAGPDEDGGLQGARSAAARLLVGVIRALIVDDQALVRGGFRLILDAQKDSEGIGEAQDGRDARELASDLGPDVVLMDVRMPGLDGLAAASRILSADPAVKVVMLTTFNEDDYVHQALRFGASGFLLKVAPPERLVESIRVAAGGDALLDPLVTRKIIEAFAATAPRCHDRPRELDQLTARESEVLHMLARGMSNAEIAAALVVGDATIKTHVARVLMKLELRDRVHAVVYAYEHGLVRPGEPSAPPARS